MASPMVAGTAALMLSLNPPLSAADLKDCLVEGATTPITGLEIGELSLPAALHCAAPTGGVITDGTVALGINPEGDLNANDVGVRYEPTGADAISPGCLCGGWDVSAGEEWRAPTGPAAAPTWRSRTPPTVDSSPAGRLAHSAELFD